MATAATCNLDFPVGDDYSLTVTLTTDGSTAINNTGRTYTAAIVTLAGAAVVSMTTAAGGSNGQITCSLTDTQTSALSATTPYRWSLVETNGTSTTTLLSGAVTVLRAGVARSSPGSLTVTVADRVTIVASGAVTGATGATGTSLDGSDGSSVIAFRVFT